MNVHRFDSLWKGEFGRLVLAAVAFGLVIAGVLYWKHLHPAAAKTRQTKVTDAQVSQSTVTTFDNNIPIFHPAPPPTPTAPTTTPSKAAPKTPLSLMAFGFSDTPRIGNDYAAYGRFLRCKLLITVDSNHIQTPIVGTLLEDVYSPERALLIPAGAEVHGMAQNDSAEDRIASQTQWILVWRTHDNQEVELPLTGIALDHAPSPTGTGWGLTDGSAGLRGQEIRSSNLTEIKLLLAQFGTGFAQSFAESGLQSVVTPSGTVLTSQNNGFQQAAAQGVQNAANLYAQQIADTVKREGIFIRVPAGTDFYVYVTQTIDASQARVGATANTHMAETTPSKLIP
jgi:type IV secretory pathway VirB10-like protein